MENTRARLQAALLALVVSAPLVTALRTLTTLSGLRMPAVGAGTAARLNSSTVATAVDLGFRLLDTAQAVEWYDEAGVGDGIKMSRQTREDLWVTTKVHPRDFGRKSTAKLFKQTQANLGTDYVDALLLHYPSCSGEMCKGATVEGGWKDAWKAFEDLHANGQAKVIGACNVDVVFLDELWAHAEVKPELVQNHMEPFYQDRAVRTWCSEHNVIYQAYSSLGTQHRSLSFNPVIESAILGRIAKAHPGRSVAQVVLQWALQEGVAVIPRSRDTNKLAANVALGSADGDDWLTESQMNDIRAMDGTNPAQAHHQGTKR